VQTYVKELATLLKNQQDEVRERNKQIDEGVFTAINDPRRPLAAPKVEEVPPALNFATLENAANALTQSAARYHKAVQTAQPRIASNAATVRAVNARLMQAERQLTDDAGLPKRSWYRHLLYAPGFYTGYAVKTMPGVREAIEQKQYREAETEIARVAKALEREAALLESVSAQLEQAQ
jgi:N-acetylated-alpha-linked acidic dipeptidase